MSVFDVVSKHVDWLSQRYAVAASNVANIDTPGFRAKDIEAFKLEFDHAGERLKVTQSGHLGSGTVGQTDYTVYNKGAADETQSGNNVSLEDEMKTLGESTRQMSMDTSIYKLFHRMILTSVRSQ
ncbi:MAG: flagellar basal body protein [Proteobacteria bacterium]|nr:flagellar basal body protein [Pseudomonadota bacterium]